MFVPGLMGTPSIALPNITGQYVRIQMQGTGYLVLAEVEVIGCAAVQQQFAVPNMFNFLRSEKKEELLMWGGVC